MNKTTSRMFERMMMNGNDVSNDTTRVNKNIVGNTSTKRKYCTDSMRVSVTEEKKKLKSRT